MIDEAQARSILEAALALLSKGRIEEGKALLQGSLDGMPETVRLESLGDIAFYERNMQQAVDYFQAALELGPERDIARYLYIGATVREREGEVVDAFKLYQAAIGAEPDFVDAYVDLGGLLGKIEDFAGAAQCYRDAARLEPDDPYTLANLKAVLERLARDEPDRYGQELIDTEKALRELTQTRKLDDTVKGRRW
jgi:tetratricopeptide (TPR) repeat protein